MSKEGGVESGVSNAGGVESGVSRDAVAVSEVREVGSKCCGFRVAAACGLRLLVLLMCLILLVTLVLLVIFSRGQ